jgi:hypothetical protein
MCFAQGLFGALVLLLLSFPQPHPPRTEGPATHAALSASVSGVIVAIIALILYGACAWLARFRPVRVVLLVIDAIASFGLLGNLISKPLTLLSPITALFLVYDLAFAIVLLRSVMTDFGRRERPAAHGEISG